MNQIHILCKAYLKNSSIFSRGRLVALKRQRQLWIIPLIGFGLISAFLSFGSLLLINYRSIFQLGAAFGHPDFVLLMALLMSWVLTLVLSSTSGISILYTAKDTHLLMPLPIRMSAIVTSRLIVLFLGMLPLHLFIMIPALYVFGSTMGFTLTFLTNGVILLLIGSLIPVMISAAVSSLIAKLAGKSKHKRSIEILGMLIMLALIISFQSLLTRMSVSGLESTSAVYQYLATRIERFYTDMRPLAWAASSIGQGDFLDLLRFAAATAAVSAFMWWYIQHGYQQMLWQQDMPDIESRRSPSLLSRFIRPSAHQEQSGQQKTHRDEPIRFREPRNLMSALIHREWTVINSKTSFIMQIWLEILIVPIMIVVMMATGSLGDISQLYEFLTSVRFVDLYTFGILVLLFLISTNAATTISREGKLLPIVKSLPVEPMRIVQAKIAVHLMTTYIPFLVYVVIVYVLLPLELSSLLFIIPGGFTCMLLSAMIAITVDLRRPFLTWNHPQQAMKQNLNVLISMGLLMGTFAIPAGIVFVLMTFTPATMLTIGLTILVIVAGLILLAHRILKRTAVWFFSSMHQQL